MAIGDNIKNLDQVRREFKASLPDPSTGVERRVTAGVALRRLLDEGQIDVETFLNEGRKIADTLRVDFATLGGQGSGAATRGRNLQNIFVSNSGFNFDEFGDVAVDLPESFQQRVREELLPENITGEEREELLSQIPLDIGFDTDEFRAIREGIRQRRQLEEQVAESQGIREERLGDLANLLAEQSNRQFGLDAINIGEAAQGAGIFNTTGLADALARRRLDLERESAFRLAEQGLTDREAEVLGLEGALARAQEFQTSGLQREFSIDDFIRQGNLARELGLAARPQTPRGKTSGEKLAQGAVATGALAGGLKGGR